jgi:hypothetical protein
VTTPQQPPPQPATGQDAALVTAVGSALLSATGPAIALTMIPAGLLTGGIGGYAMGAALQIVMSFPPGQSGAYGAATLAMERSNLLRRAQFTVAAARRIAQALASAHSTGQPLSQALAAAVQRERRFYAQHLMAIWQRSQAGAAADSAAMSYGNLLGWHTVRDARTSADCLAANGKNFYADHMPLIGYPGAVHPHCRCRPGPPFPGAAMLAVPGAGRYRRAA